MSRKRQLLVLALLCQFAFGSAESFAAGADWEIIRAIGKPTARHEAALVGFDDKLYLIGGRRINPVDVFDPFTNRWMAHSPTPMELHHFQAVVYGDRIFLMGAMSGGYPTEKPLEKVVTYDPKNDKFEMLHTIPVDRRRGGAGAVVYKDKIYLVGGITNGHIDGFKPWFDEYDPKTGTWRTLPDAPHARDHFQAVVIGDRLYAAAGRTTSQATKEVFSLTVETIDVFDFKTGKWLPSQDCPKVPTQRAGNMAIGFDGKLIVGGGESSTQRNAHDEVEVYDPATNEWSKWASLQRGRHGSGFVQVGNYLYTASGCGNRGGNPELDSIERLELAVTSRPLVMPAALFAESAKPGYYLDKGKWLAVHPDRNKEGKVGRTFPYPTGNYDVTLRAVGESDGQSTYQVRIDDELVGDFKAPLSKQMFEEGTQFNKTWKNVAVTEGAIIQVSSKIGSSDGKEFSRARWAAIDFVPADVATRKLVAPILAKQTIAKSEQDQSRDSSPTKNVSDVPLIQPRKSHGSGDVTITGELKQWHNVTLTMDGPYAHEQDNTPNPFTDYRMTVTFTHTDGTVHTVPGYFAADGDAKNSSAEAGTKWRAHFAPGAVGKWKYSVAFHQGKHAALDAKAERKALVPFDGHDGTIVIAASDKSGRDLRAQGRLQYVGQRYLQFAGSGKYFLKVGADAPETLLAYADFDNTISGKPRKAPVKTWEPHVRDWNDGDPTWKDGKGKGLIGAINYLSGKGCNAFSFLTYNAGGDGDNVWPFIQRDDKLHYDCSKLDQWATVFEHGTRNGMYLHFKMQETENDDHNSGKGKKSFVPTSLDGGNLGLQRKLYCRELVARFGHNLALNWNLGEENTQTTAQQKAMIDYIAATDTYDHNIVIHSFPRQQDKVYNPLLGAKSKLTGASLQNSSLKTTHAQTVKWVEASTKAGKPWVVAFDESGSAAHAQCPDLGYKGFDGRDRSGKMIYTQHEVRKQTLWGQLIGGGAGCEYYFGYQFAENDIVCEDWRSRDKSWDYCRIAIQFFHENEIPFWEMHCKDELVGNANHGISKFCFVKPNDTYLVYLPNGGRSQLDLSAASGAYSVQWFNPREGGGLTEGDVTTVKGGSKVGLGHPPTDTKEDWLVVVRSAN